MLKPNLDSSTASSAGGTSQGNCGLWDQPNKFARPPAIELINLIRVHGYQEFQIEDGKVSPLPIDVPLQRKHLLAGPYFTPDFLTGKTLLDIGANGGFFSLLACQSGAAGVVSLDMDETYLAMIEKARAFLAWPQIKTVHCRVQDWQEPADVVLAFAMVHWLYSCTASFGSLDAIAAKLASLSRLVLLIEWVAPNDPAILSFKHTDWNPDQATGPYSLEAFESALRAHFYKVEVIGATSSTRVFYAAYRTSNEISIHPALPLLAPVGRVVSSRCLTSDRGVGIYSRVYTAEQPGQLIKQATGDMAMHEGEVLGRLRGAHFPRVIAAEQRDGYSVLTLERISGPGLVEVVADVAATPGRLAKFMGECLGILRELEAAAIEHRDIRMENILVRDRLPVLIDFGWAQVRGTPFGVPSLLPGLGGLERIPSGPPCDLYSMGKVFEQLVPRKSALFAPLLDPMLNPDCVRQLKLSALVAVLDKLKLPAEWDVPLVFPVALQHTAVGENGADFLVPASPAFFTRTWRRWKRSLRKRLAD